MVSFNIDWFLRAGGFGVRRVDVDLNNRCFVRNVRVRIRTTKFTVTGKHSNVAVGMFGIKDIYTEN